MRLLHLHSVTLAAGSLKLSLLEVNLPTSDCALSLELWGKSIANYAVQGCFDALTAGSKDGISDLLT